MTTFYRREQTEDKNGRLRYKYKSVGRETPRFLCDGIWLVQKNGDSAQQLLKIGDIRDINPFKDMAQSVDQLTRFIQLWVVSRFYDSITIYPDNSMSFSFGSSRDIAVEMIKFLALTDEEQEEEIKRLQELNVEFEDGRFRGKYATFARQLIDVTLEQVESVLDKKKREIKQLKNLKKVLKNESDN